MQAPGSGPTLRLYVAPESTALLSFPAFPARFRLWISADCERIITIEDLAEFRRTSYATGGSMADAKLQTRIRREQIAEAALQLVASEGVKRLSIAAVARRVGLVPSGIYRHFKSKDAMLDAVLDLLDAKLQANVEAARKETADPLDRLHGLFLRHIRIIREGQAFPRIIFSDEALAARPDARPACGGSWAITSTKSNAWSAKDSSRAKSTGNCCPARRP